MINYKTVEKIVKSNIMVSSITGIIEEVNVEEIVDQILDSLPKLSREISFEDIVEKLNEDEFDAELYLFLDDEKVTFRNAEHQETRNCMLEDLCNEIIKKVVTKICSLVPEHKWVQTTDDRGNVIVPLGEVIARGKVSYGEHDRVLISIPASHENIYEFWRVMDVYMVNHKKELEGKTIKIIIREVSDE